MKNKFIEALKKAKATNFNKVVNKQEENFECFTLQELRAKFPNIKARSKDEFLNKVKK